MKIEVLDMDDVETRLASQQKKKQNLNEWLCNGNQNHYGLKSYWLNVDSDYEQWGCKKDLLRVD